MENYQSGQIRNVVLLSHNGAGKTSLSEAMLFQSKAITRLGKVDDGATTSDYDPEEVKRKISLNTSLLPLEWNKTRINILDAPGYADFVGEVKAALRVAEGAVIVVCAASGVEVGTELVWKYAEDKGVPRILFINKIDRENADFFKTLEQLETTFGRKCVPIQLPIGSESSFEGVLDLITTKPSDAPSNLADKVAAFRDKLAEAAAEPDDDLITKYLEGEELTEEELRRGLRAGTTEGKVVPVMVGSALQNKGVTELMDAICSYLPSPKDKGKITARNPQTQQEEAIDPEDAAPLSALVFKTTADPYVGKLTYLRVYSGAINSDSSVWNANKNRAERIGQLYRIRGKAQEPVSRIAAGDIGAVAKLAETGTSDTLCNKEHPLILEAIEFPLTAMSVAVYPKTKADLDKMGAALTKLSEEDSTISVHKDPVTAETVLSGMGEAHFDVAVEKIKRKFGVELKIDTPKIPYKETITVPVKAEYKHKKQTGGHGQYGHVLLQLEPLPRGSGSEFGAKVVGGSVPKNYIPAVEKGVTEALNEGVLAGYPVTDLMVKLYDGSYHSVDSSDIAFKIASSHAVRKGVSEGLPVMLEPIMNVQITIPDSFTGDVMSDLNGKRAKVLGMTPGDGINVIDAHVPLAEMLKYAIDLRSITQGRGSHTMEFSHYEEVPQHITQRIISQSKKESEKA
ncbi:MAG: elongation factor G [Dehalococcoidia bacterium]|nr:MAG: elongation factor G [Dehalococcoidia bacterium]